MHQSVGLAYACFFLLFNVATTVTSHPLCNVLNSDTGLHKQHAGKLLGSIRKAIQDSNVQLTQFKNDCAAVTHNVIDTSDGSKSENYVKTMIENAIALLKLLSDKSTQEKCFASSETRKIFQDSVHSLAGEFAIVNEAISECNILTHNVVDPTPTRVCMDTALTYLDHVTRTTFRIAKKHEWMGHHISGLDTLLIRKC